MENEKLIIQYVLDRLTKIDVGDLMVTLNLSLKLIDGLDYYDADKALKIIFAGGEETEC